jgi:hypothetical protein
VKGEGAGRMANAPPPDEFQFTLIYFCNGIRTDSCMRSGNSTHARCRDDVRIPGTAGYLEVVDTVLFLGRLAKDMSMARIRERSCADKNEMLPIF